MKTVTFETQCWENDYEYVLTGDRLQKTIANCNYKFSEKHLIINKVYNRKKVTLLAEACKKKGVIDHYYFAEDYIDQALKHFKIKPSSFKGGYYYSRCQLVGLFLCKTDYLLHFTTDTCIEHANKSTWVNDGIQLMESDKRFVCASPSWSIGKSATSAIEASQGAKDEAEFEIGDWYAGYGFSDNCYLVPTALFRQPIFNENHPASDRFPGYAGECFEKRVDSYMHNHGLLRITNKNIWYTHTNFAKKRHVAWLGKWDKTKRLGRAGSRRIARVINHHTGMQLFSQPVRAEEIATYRKTIKIYDIFTFFNELELLEIRLNMLYDHVDHFVIIESTETFSGNPKPLCFAENKDRFKKFQDKIIHYVIDDVPKDEADLRARLTSKKLPSLDREIIENALTSDNVPKGATHWLKEFFQKESIKKALVGLHDNDVCFVSDVDEIWNPEALVDFRRDDIFKLRQEVYSYYLNNHSSEPWAGTLVTKYKNIKNGCLNHLRTVSKTKYTYIKNGGWHFTNQGGADRIRKKIESYGHQEFNNEAIKGDIEKKIQKNMDFVGRKFRFHVDESMLPTYIKENRKRYESFFK